MNLIFVFLLQQSIFQDCFSAPDWFVVPGYPNQYYPGFENPVNHVREGLVECARRGAILAVCHETTVKTFIRYYLKLNNRK